MSLFSMLNMRCMMMSFQRRGLFRGGDTHKTARVTASPKSPTSPRSKDSSNAISQTITPTRENAKTDLPSSTRTTGVVYPWSAADLARSALLHLDPDSQLTKQAVWQEAVNKIFAEEGMFSLFFGPYENWITVAELMPDV